MKWRWLTSLAQRAGVILRGSLMQSKKPVPRFSWASMDLARARAFPSAPSEEEGWFTVADYCERYKVTRSAADYQLDRLVNEGKLERRKARNFRSRVATYFREIKPERKRGKR